MSKGNACKKRIIAMILIVLAVVCVECCFNFYALVNNGSDVDLSQNIQIIQDGDKEYYSVAKSFPEGIYVRQIKLLGNWNKQRKYTVKVTVLNPFDKIEEMEFEDYTNSWFSEYYTNIDQKILGLEISLRKEEGQMLKGVIISSSTSVNLYRVAFFTIVFVLLYCVFFESAFKEKLENFFLVFSFAFGILLLLYSKMLFNVWDEQIHFERAYRMASGKTVEWTQAISESSDAYGLKLNTIEEYQLLQDELDAKHLTISRVDNYDDYGITYYSLTYIVTAFFIKVGMWLQMPFSKLIPFGRFANLLIYILLMYFAVKWSKKKKLFLMAIALMPTSLFLACSYSYDAIVLASIVLASVMWTNSMCVLDYKQKVWSFMGMLGLYLIGALAKPVYLPLLLVILLVPLVNQISTKIKLRIAFAVFLISLVVIISVVVPNIDVVLQSGDSRGGDTNVGAQLISMLHHPLESIRLFATEILSVDNFRNSGVAALNDFTIGNLMFLNFYRWGVMADKWCVLLVLLLFVLLCMKEKDGQEYVDFSAKQKVYVLLVLVVTVVLIWLAMYLPFTPVGDNSIAGVQARYYLPLLYLTAVLFSGKHICVSVSQEGITCVTMSILLLFMSVGVYQFSLCERLF